MTTRSCSRTAWASTWAASPRVGRQTWPRTRPLEAGLAWALVSAGGDLRIAGDAPALDLTVEDPDRGGGSLATLRLASGALATSTTVERTWGHGLHHVIDPTTGAPADAPLVQATVWAPTCARGRGPGDLGPADRAGGRRLRPRRLPLTGGRPADEFRRGGGRVTTWILLRAAGMGAYVMLFLSVAWGLVATTARRDEARVQAVGEPVPPVRGHDRARAARRAPRDSC